MLQVHCAVMDTVSLEQFKLWSTNALKVFLRLRKKKTDGTFEELSAIAYAAWEENIEVCPTAEHEERKFMDEYTSKLKFNTFQIPDPLEIPKQNWISEVEGIVKWPSVYYHDIAKYLNYLAPDFISKLESEYKLGKAYRYFSCQFVREIYFYDVDFQYCFLKYKVIPSHRVSNQPYDVWTLVKKDTPETPGVDIIASYCTCVAGLQGGCNHVAGMLFRIESAVASGATHPSKTSTSCQWDIPSGNKINLKPTKAEEIFFSKTKYTTSKANADKQKHAKQKFKQYKPSLHNKHMKTNENEIRNSLFASLKSDIKHSSISEMMVGKRPQVLSLKQVPLPQGYLYLCKT